MRPPLPLHKVRKGYPMRGTYCDKHAQLHRQYEMLEQQMLAEEHGLSFTQCVRIITHLAEDLIQEVDPLLVIGAMLNYLNVNLLGKPL